MVVELGDGTVTSERKTTRRGRAGKWLGRNWARKRRSKEKREERWMGWMWPGGLIDFFQNFPIGELGKERK